jgi:hypothetical protein
MRFRKWTAVFCSLLLTLMLLGGCGRSEKVDTQPTTQNPEPYPGMEQAKGRGTLRLPRGGNDEGGGK